MQDVLLFMFYNSKLKEYFREILYNRVYVLKIITESFLQKIFYKIQLIFQTLKINFFHAYEKFKNCKRI